MKQMFLGALIAATFLTPAAQAAETPYTKGQQTAATVVNDDVSDYRRGGHGGDGRDGGRRGGSAQGQQQGQNAGNWQPAPRDNDNRNGEDRGWRQGNRSTDNGGNWQNQPQSQPQPRNVEPRREDRWRGQANTGDYRGNRSVDNDRRDRDSDRGWTTGRNENTDQRGYERRGRGNDDGWNSGRDRDGRWDNGNGRRDDDRRWNNGWRNDQRYNWRGHRQRNQSHYRIGRYYSPDRHHSYRRFSIGFYIGAPYYHDRYWINDPWSYRLPDVYGPYRWVRYYDDVLLIDLRNGYVVDTIYDFFW